MHSVDVGNVIDDVAAAIREIGTTEVLARFGQLTAGDITEKSPGDLVTTADQACERALTAALQSLIDVPVVGEEATEADPSLLDLVAGADAIWVVDPVDGTANFAVAKPDFAVMVAHIEAGHTTAGWIWLPVTDRLVSAQLGAGVVDDGRLATPLRSEPTTAPDLGGVIKYRYLPEPERSEVAAIAAQFPAATDHRCAGIEYLDLLDGASAHLAYWRTKPWDHAPGSLIACEAGLRSGRFNGDPYRPGDRRLGLLTATSARWRMLGDRLDEATQP